MKKAHGNNREPVKNGRLELQKRLDKFLNPEAYGGEEEIKYSNLHLKTVDGTLLIPKRYSNMDFQSGNGNGMGLSFVEKLRHIFGAYDVNELLLQYNDDKNNRSKFYLISLSDYENKIRFTDRIFKIDKKTNEMYRIDIQTSFIPLNDWSYLWDIKLCKDGIRNEEIEYLEPVALQDKPEPELKVKELLKGEEVHYIPAIELSNEFRERLCREKFCESYHLAKSKRKRFTDETVRCKICKFRWLEPTEYEQLEC